MSILVTVDFEFKTDAGAEQMIATMKERISSVTRSYDGCEEIDLYVDQENSKHIVLVEQWASNEHYDKYLEWAMSQPGTQELTELLARDMSIQRFEKIAT